MIIVIALLALIAVLIAPWLLAAIALAVAAYGLYIVIAIVAVFVCAIGLIIWLTFSAVFVRRKERVVEIKGERKACTSCQLEMPLNATKCGSCGGIN